jgi:ATP-dependent Lon protease
VGFAIRMDDRERCPSGRLPLLPLRDVVVFPHMTLPLFVGRPSSVAAIERTRESDRLLFATAQRRPEVTEPEAKDLHSAGTLARVLQVFRLPDGTMRVLVEGVCRARLVAFHACEVGSEVEIEPIPELVRQPRSAARGLQNLQNAFAEFHGLSRRVPEDIYTSVLASRDPVQAAYLIAGQVIQKVNPRQDVLEAADAESRLAILGRYLDAEVAALRAAPRAPWPPEAKLESKSRRPAGDENEGGAEIEELESAIRSARMPAPVRTKALQELERLARMPAFSPEATVTRGYLLWLTGVPWNRRTRDRRDLRAAEEILDAGHHGLRKVKDRILEHLAVVQLTRRVRGPVLCLVGPPGVGKTSLGESIAEALGRNFARISLGGLRDEAEIRGHRRTYIGAMPGRIVQAMRRAGSVNPVLLLDEVDKIGSDYRGDPAAALLEVLDPEQNHSFSDHYLEVDYDLSQVLFVTTANRLEEIPHPLLDRMELIRLPGYLETEKLEIAHRHLLPKQMEAVGLEPGDASILPETIHRLVRGYTREAGVRGLEREIASILRKAARAKASGSLADGYTVDLEELERLLGPPRYA